MAWPNLAALALATGVVAQPTLAPPAPDPATEAPPPQSEVLTLYADPHERLTLPVTIGGVGPFQFVIDTGAQATVVSRELADRLQLNDRSTATLVGLASRRTVETAWISDLAFGSRNIDVQTAPLVEGAHIGGADGILGLDSLQDQRVLLDFPNRRIAVADAAELGGNKGYEIIVRARERLGQLIITSARVDGVRVALIVDTGAQGSTGNPRLMSLLNRRTPIGKGTMTDVNGFTVAGSLYPVRELWIGRAGVRNFPIMIADSPTFDQLGLTGEPALILGMSELKLFRRVAIDFKTRRVLFDLPPEAIQRLDSLGA